MSWKELNSLGMQAASLKQFQRLKPRLYWERPIAGCTSISVREMRCTTFTGPQAGDSSGAHKAAWATILSLIFSYRIRVGPGQEAAVQ